MNRRRTWLLSVLLAACLCVPPACTVADSLGVRTDLDALDPAFRTRVVRVLAVIEGQGHPARLVTTWRDPRRQEVVYLLGRVGERLGRGPGTLVRGGRSCHNRVVGERPAASAVDVRPAARLDHAGQVRFFRALGRAARAQGLQWGGDWKRRDPTWAADDLGWDPGHVESRARCRGGDG